ncbi:MAG: DinB family protein [Chloroflexota bacterium]|nr:DinB family protein [Chloroflexota bacterium]
MRATDAVILIDYLYWTRDVVLRAAARMSDDEFTSTDGVTDRDLRATLVHELDVEWSWRERLKGANWEEWGDDADLDARDYPTLHRLRSHWMRDEAEMRAWLAALTDEDLETPPPRDEDPLPLWYYVMHLVSHGIQQLSEAAVLLTRADHSPDDIGFLEFAREGAGRSEP